MLIILLLPLLTFSIIVAINFIYYSSNAEIYTRPSLWKVTEIWTGLLSPLFFLSAFDLSEKNNCCTDSAVFSPDNRVGIYFFIVLCTATYFYCSFRKQLATPIVELLLNAFLVIGVLLNVLVAVQINRQDMGTFLWLLGNIPIIMLFLIIMGKNKELLENALPQDFVAPKNALASFSIKILRANVWIRFPVFALLALPLLLLVTLALFLFGQKPDTLIRAFTDTYKHGFSQLDYMCDNVQCGGHFLCSVAAKGHRTIVQPERYGERHGHKIICNRQLLVANAFEELMQSHLPYVHKHVRRQYNKVGNLVHRYYSLFNNKFVADTVYVLMKPLEWFFLLMLYTFDTRPENRIAIQYLSMTDRMKLHILKRHTTIGFASAGRDE